MPQKHSSKDLPCKRRLVLLLRSKTTLSLPAFSGEKAFGALFCTPNYTVNSGMDCCYRSLWTLHLLECLEEPLDLVSVSSPKSGGCPV